MTSSRFYRRVESLAVKPLLSRRDGFNCLSREQFMDEIEEFVEFKRLVEDGDILRLNSGTEMGQMTRIL